MSPKNIAGSGAKVQKNTLTTVFSKDIGTVSTYHIAAMECDV